MIRWRRRAEPAVLDERPDEGDVGLSIADREQIRRIEIRTRRLASAVLGGDYRSVFRGTGIEFAEAREYTPGDDVRFIDWNVTARMGVPWVKEFVEERELSIVCAGRHLRLTARRASRRRSCGRGGGADGATRLRGGG